MDKEKQHIGPAVHNLSRQFRRCIQLKELASGAEPLMANYGWIIGYLYHHQGQDIYQRDLESSFHLARSSITGIVQTMEGLGYIQRTQVKKDARLKKIELTPAGFEFHARTARNIEAVEETAVSGITVEELTVFLDVLDRMQQNLCSITMNKETPC